MVYSKSSRICYWVSVGYWLCFVQAARAKIIGKSFTALMVYCLKYNGTKVV